MKTISVLDQIKASRKIYADILVNGGPEAAARTLSLLSDAGLARPLSCLSDADLARALPLMSDAGLARALPLMSDAAQKRLNLAIPVVPDVDKLVAASVGDGENLEMKAWHTCETVHCWGGWIVFHAGELGHKLEEAFGPERAASLIYEASTGRPAPDLYSSNEEALAEIKRRAAL